MDHSRSPRSFLALLPLLALLTSCAQVSGQTIASVFSDHCVLQREMPVPIWGTAKPGATVRVTFGAQTVETPATRTGDWRATLEPLAASSEPQTLIVESGGERIEIVDVLVGEVWVCGGQSNMEFPVRGSIDAENEIAAGDLPRIRVISPGHRLSSDSMTSTDAKWLVCTPETIGSFTAIGTFMARELQEELDVPIGLLSINWGGTRAEPWTDPAALAKHPRFKTAVLAFEQRRKEWAERDMVDNATAHRRAIEGYEERMKEWWDKKLKDDPGTLEGWVEDDFDDSEWASMPVPGLWRDTIPETASFDGTMWYRHLIEIPKKWEGKELRIDLGPIDDADRTWLGGALVGQTTHLHDQERSYAIPASAVTAGRHAITIAVIDTGGEGGMSGAPADFRIAPVGSPAAAISLAGEWRARTGNSFDGNRGPGRPGPPAAPDADSSGPGLMFNAMLRPFIPYAIRGAIWYQGESNADDPDAYRELLPLMITSWRQAWGQGNFPFGIVQLAAFRPASDDPNQGAWAFLRDAQRHAHLTVPETGLVITTDVGAADDIHPRNKQEVGRRLALWALATVHKKWIEHTGPTLLGVRPYDDSGGGTQVLLSHSRELRTRDGGPVGGFGVAGEDGVYHWVEAEIRGQSIILHHPEGEEIRHVRHAWSDNPVRSNLVNGDGLPAEPFRWDG